MYLCQAVTVFSCLHLLVGNPLSHLPVYEQEDEHSSSELIPVPVKCAWYHLGLDFVGPISPPSNQYILTISDYFTKFAQAKATPTKEAVNVITALREVQCVVVV